MNRVLRYPQKSKIISDWAKKNFYSDLACTRRAEILSWIIDVNPDIVLNKQTIIDDFEILNSKDLKAVEDFESEISAINVIERDLQGILPKNNYHFLGYKDDLNTIVPYPELKLQNRFYPTIIDSSKRYEDPMISIPDFELMRNDFHQNIETYINLIMLWAIAYSRLDLQEKSQLLIKYYKNDTLNSFIKICKKQKLSEPLKWLLSKLKFEK